MELFLNCIVNNIDMMIFYLLFIGLTYQRVYFTIKGVTLSFLCGTALGICGTVLELNVYKLIFYSSILVTTKIFYKKNIYDTFIVFELMNAIILSVQFLAVFIVMQFLSNEDLIVVLGQIVTLLITVIIYFKINIYRILEWISNSLVIKSLVFALNIVLFVVLFYEKFDIQELEPFIGFYVLLICISVAGFSQTILKVKQLTEEVQATQHEFDNVMTAIAGIISTSDSVSDIKEKTKEYLKLVDKDDKITQLLNEDQQDIAIFIHSKAELARSKEIDLRSEIDFQSINKFVSVAVINKMLGILLDNAIDSSPIGKIIEVTIYIDSSHVIIKIINECEWISAEKRMKMFDRGYSTKENQENHGYGLYNLKKMIIQYNGIVSSEMDYNKIYDSWVIIMKVEI